MFFFEDHWQSQGNITLYSQRWEPKGAIRGIVCLVHGLGEHSGRYAHLAEHLTRSGYALMAFDLRGHGKSGGPRGHTPSLETFLSDIDQLLDKAESFYPHKPCFLYGHSLGGILVLNYALRRKPNLAGVIATSPALRSALESQTLKITLSKLLGQIWPTLTLPTGLDITQISRDPVIRQSYTNDPLVHNRATTSMALHTLNAISWAFDHAHEFPAPLLLMHGSQDQIAFPAGSQEFARRVPGDCTMKVWDGRYHEIHNDPGKEEVFAYLLRWLEQHCPI